MLAFDGKAGPGILQQQERCSTRQQVFRDRIDGLLSPRLQIHVYKAVQSLGAEYQGQNSGVPGRLFFTRCRDDVSG